MTTPTGSPETLHPGPYIKKKYLRPAGLSSTTTPRRRVGTAGSMRLRRHRGYRQGNRVGNYAARVTGTPPAERAEMLRRRHAGHDRVGPARPANSMRSG